MAPARKPTSASGKLTLAQLASYDDILTDAVVDHVYYWTNIPKNRPSYHPSRGIKEEEIAKIIQSHIVLGEDLAQAEEKLLATAGLKKFYGGLKTQKEKDDFRKHLRRYTQMYMPDCPFEVNATNRYTIVSYEASITARKLIRRGENIRYLSGVQVNITPEEEAQLSSRKKDFSIVVSSRNKCASLFMGPARFANHDCHANAKLVTTGQAGIEIHAIRDIAVDEEITVSYSDSYFGENNCECLCASCEAADVNGWTAEDRVKAVPPERSIEDDILTGYSLRTRSRRRDSLTASRSPSVTPITRPKVSKSRPKAHKAAKSEQSAIEPGVDSISRKRKRDSEELVTPPITPVAKKQKLSYEVPAAPQPAESPSSSTDGSVRGDSSSVENDAVMTDATSPEDSGEPAIRSLTPARIAGAISVLKQEEVDEPDVAQVPVLVQSPLPLLEPKQTAEALVPTIETRQEQAATPEVGVIQLDERNSSSAIPSPPSSQESPFKVPALPASATETAKTEGDENSAIADVPEEQTSSATPTKRQRKAPRKETFPKQATPPPRARQPGDYTLTPLLLAEPEMAWISCTICETTFVQHNAYYTRSSCPRCERHSKLYGYVWPKTKAEGKKDREERVLDHRTVHRFLDAEEERRARGRKSIGAVAMAAATKKTRESEDTTDDEGGPRRSGRARKASMKAAGLD